MEEIVRQFAEQSGLGWAVARANIQGQTQDLAALEQFAELIILECIKAVDGTDTTAGDNIIEHFGLR